MTLSPASSLARTETPEARATARLGAATRKSACEVGSEDARVSRLERNTPYRRGRLSERATAAMARRDGEFDGTSRRANAHR